MMAPAGVGVAVCMTLEMGLGGWVAAGAASKGSNMVCWAKSRLLYVVLYTRFMYSTARCGRDRRTPWSMSGGKESPELDGKSTGHPQPTLPVLIRAQPGR